MSLINDALKRAKQTHQEQAANEGDSPTAATVQQLQPVEHRAAGGGGLSLVKLAVPLVLLGVGGWFLWNGSNHEQATTSAKATPPKAESKPALVRAMETAGGTIEKVQARHAEAGLETKPAAKPSQPETQLPSANSSALEATPAKVATPLPSESPIATAAPANTSSPQLPVAEPAPVQTPAQELVAAAPALSNPESQTPAPKPEPASDSPGFLKKIVQIPNKVAAAVAPPPPAGPPPDFKLQGIFYRMHKPTVLINGRILSVGDEIENHRIVAIERHAVQLASSGRTNTLSLR